MELSKEILDSFILSGDIVSLSGGQNTSVRISNAVLKTVDDIHHSEWLLNILYNLNPKGYRVSKPIRVNTVLL
ncbi:hypothetical protein [Paenibacillus radicis (ex Xue et al. 2023)]|uniref:Homing endonuclease LAGLIDADG domain-containing protein n=1 Tax=Paenibacillus radicis (ex Xue et al. 2023) TaxID=2972489 RepID=A0ABT1YG08_9BACL|nr:hypothetical protein [Paenibacillus radicis (ex Xue et al. 2023)]MCR8632132.1 hypothetical protein [Paenibacillus radicis (ex Xue et al. 2023)]